MRDLFKSIFSHTTSMSSKSTGSSSIVGESSSDKNNKNNNMTTSGKTRVTRSSGNTNNSGSTSVKKEAEEEQPEEPAGVADASTEKATKQTGETAEAAAATDASASKEPPAVDALKEDAAVGEDGGKKSSSAPTEKEDGAEPAATPKNEPAATPKNESGDENNADASASAVVPGVVGTNPFATKEVMRTIFWQAASVRYDEVDIHRDITFDKESQTILTICNQPFKSFPNTHFMRRLAGHWRLGLGRNATKEAILERICEMHFGDDYKVKPERVYVAADTPETATGKRRSSEANSSSTVLKKRPVVVDSRRQSAPASTRRGSTAMAAAAAAAASSSKNNLRQFAAENAMQARAAALTALTASLQTIATTIRQAEDRLQNLCKAVNIDFYAALMDRSLVPNDYLRGHFEEYDQFMATQKQMVASMTELGTPKKDKDAEDKPAATSTSTPVGGAGAATPSSGMTEMAEV